MKKGVFIIVAILLLSLGACSSPSATATSDEEANAQITELKQDITELESKLEKEQQLTRQLEEDKEALEQEIEKLEQDSKETTTSKAESPKSPAISDYELQLLATSSERSYDFIIISGEVKNISNENLENVVAVVSYYDEDGSFVKSDDALIKYNPILSNQTSPFEVMTIDDPDITSFKVEFKFLFGGTIPTEVKDKESSLD